LVAECPEVATGWISVVSDFVGPLLTVLGWFAVHALTQFREEVRAWRDRTSRTEARVIALRDAAMKYWCAEKQEPNAAAVLKYESHSLGRELQTFGVPAANVTAMRAAVSGGFFESKPKNPDPQSRHPADPVITRELDGVEPQQVNTPDKHIKELFRIAETVLKDLRASPPRFRIWPSIGDVSTRG
jgi:hypothetical protein